MQTAIIYSRISSAKQDNKSAIEDLKNYAKYKNLKILEIFQETITGTSKAEERVEFANLITYIKDHHVQHLLVWELSRLGRSLSNILYVVELLTKEKVNIYIKNNGGLNTLNDDGTVNNMGKLMISLLGSFAELEIQLFKERSKRGLRANVERGGSGTGIIKPYGFKKDKKELLIDEEEADVVRLIFSKSLDGLGTLQIANFLNNASIPTRFNKVFSGKIVKTKKGIEKEGSMFDWKEGTIYGILTNSIYKGQRKYKDEIFAVDKIISEETFDNVNRLLNERYNKKGNNHKYENILKDKIKCGYCGYNFFMHKRADGKDSAYKCTSIRYHQNCGNGGISINKINNAIYRIVNHRVQKHFNLTHDKQIEVKKLIDNNNLVINNLKQNLNKENARLEELLDMRLDKQVSSKAYTKKYNEINQVINSLNEKLLKVQGELINNQDILNTLKNVNIKDLAADVNVFKRYIHQLLNVIKIYKVKELETLQDMFIKKQDNIFYAELETVDGGQYSFILSQRTNILLLVNMSSKRKTILDKSNEYFDYDKKVFKGKCIFEFTIESKVLI